MQKEQVELTFTQVNGIIMDEATATTAIAHVDISAKSLNIYGNIHGGLLYSLADNVAGMCARATGNNHVTLQGSMNYLKGISSGRITAKAIVVHRGRTTCVLDVNIFSEDNLCLAKGTFTMYNVGT
jgi:uncharacterized domain 1